MSGGLPNMGNTCYVNAALQAIQSVVSAACPTTDADGPLLRALRRFVDTKDEASATAFLGLVGEALRRDMYTPSDSSEFLHDLISLLALENGAIDRAFQSTWVPASVDICCAACGKETPAPEEAYAGLDLGLREHVTAVPVFPEIPRMTLAEALPLLERKYQLKTDAKQDLTCPACGSVGRRIIVRRKLVPPEVLVLSFANPFMTTVNPSFNQKLMDATYALVSVTGFKDGHYTALVNNGYGWRLCDDKYTGDHSIETYFTWSHATMAVFQRTVEVTLSGWLNCRPESRVQVGGTFSNWGLLDATWDGKKECWTAKVQATHGVHMYKWVADGVWTLAVGVETVLDSAGNENHVLYV